MPVHLTEKNLGILRQLMEKHFPQAKLWAYGSRVNGGSHNGSDLDMAVVAETPVSNATLNRFLEELDDSRFSTLFDVLDYRRLPLNMQENILRGYEELWPGIPVLKSC